MGGEGSTTRREALRASALALALLAADGPPATAGVRHRRHGKHHKPASTRHPRVSKLLPDPHTIAARGGNPADLGLLECASLLQAGLLSSRELTGACLARIEQRNDPLNAWVRIYASDALAAAAAADQQLAAARSGRCKPGSLVVGAPIGLKDLYPVAGQLLTASSRILAGNRATVDCPVWATLATAGMVLLGHTAMHEFAAGNFTPQCSNPWDHARTPGGSSGGSAIALAARMLPAATGSDTLGSLRIPASICGVSALKPTRGLVSTRNLIPLARSFDHAGPLARSAGDLALMLAYMRSPGGTPGYLVRPARSRRPLAGVRIGIPDQTFGGLSPTAAIAARVESFGRELEQLGATRVPFTAPRSPADNLSSPSGTQFFLTVPGAEINRYHSRYFPQRALEYTPDVRVLLGLLRAANTVPSDPRTGSTTIAQLAASWARTFTIHRLDAVLQPAALIETPKKANAFAQTMSIGDPMVVWDYTGFPALCVPAGRSAATGLPIGVQLAGAPGSERRLLRIGIEAQAHYPHHKAAPPGLA